MSAETERFPSGEYTPFGYLRNPGHRATSWRECVGGNLRTARDWVGLEWAYPTQRQPATRIGLAIEVADRRSRADFDALGLTSRYHSALIFGFDWADGSARFFLLGEDVLCARVRGDASVVGRTEATRAPLGDGATVLADTPAPHVAMSRADRTLTVLARGNSVAGATERAHVVLEQADAVYASLLAEDATFYARCPVLEGDWPAGWREGLIYDFETTRLLVQPPSGVFADVWPSWMAAWPRVVLAEGALDMLRLSYAQPSLAQRAVSSMFDSASDANVPCVFFDGTPNMVAADGSVCGTSPAWCLPFVNLELLYLRMPDPVWLGRIYPRLARYVDWWLRERTDPEGWLVYKCTWEAGEDGNPRLDPSGSGDADISGFARPVELQATVAHAAGVLAFFASRLGFADEMARWHAIERTYRQRTRMLFDSASGRHRDWVRQPHEPGAEYWGIDPHQQSVLGLTPALIGEPVPFSEFERHARPPWTLWPSWTYALLECAVAAGHHAWAGALAARLLEHVYQRTTRHDGLGKPMPGCAPEFWPVDWDQFDGSEAYGWGATTANLLLRHVVGFRESRESRGQVAELVPAMPADLLARGALRVRNLSYRGLSLDLTYRATDEHTVQAELELPEPRQCTVTRGVRVIYRSRAPAARHSVPLAFGQRHRLHLQ